MLPDDAGARLAAWLASEVEPSVTAVALTRLDGGHSSGAWRVDVTGGRPTGPLVLKAPELPSVVHRRDACREGRILLQLGRAGAPVPPVVAIDGSGGAVGRPCFVMELVEGRSVNDTGPGGPHADPELQEAGARAQRAVWDSFHDALAAMHRIDPAEVPEASFGPNGLLDVLAYWREALLDAAPAEQVPRQLAMLAWLEEHLPADAYDAPAVCLGDARLVNGLVVGDEVRALVDFEVAYVGNPAADIAYSLFIDAQQRMGAEAALPGFPTVEETWERWERATGRRIDDRAYWTAFGAMILVVTATRAMVQWGLAGPSVEDDNSLVAAWEATVEEATAR
jgi:aminoglycoside phosphotransferase (APT) family kinase protein